MIATIQYKSRKLAINLEEPLDISIPLKGNASNVNAWYIGPPKIEPEVIEDKIISVSEGAAVNFNTIIFNPHAHGTHTETIGHITKEDFPINTCLKQFFFIAEVISVAPEKAGEDYVISAKQLQFAIGNKKREAIIIRTLPNMKDKKSKQYSHSNWTYLQEDAVKLLVRKGIKHLLIDLPSVDKEEDGGELRAHKAFWYHNGVQRTEATITEMIYVSNKIDDGMYVLNLQIAPFVNDASPSKPILYKVIE